MRPSDCEHGELTVDSHFWPDYVYTIAKCKECGIKVKVQIPHAKVNAETGLPPLKNIENIIRQSMTRVANGALPKRHPIRSDQL